MSNAKYRHMEEAWGIDGNPFPADTMRQGNEPYSRELFSEEHEDFFSKLIYGAAMDKRGFSFLWSKGPNGEDTGFGKTTLLENGAKEINKDFGTSVLLDAGSKRESVDRHKMVAAYTSLNTMSVTGVYPILFAATGYLADPKNGSNGQSILDSFRAQIRTTRGIDENDGAGLEVALRDTRRSLGATLPPLRADLVEAFCAGEDGALADFLSTVSDATRIRNGLAYFDFAFTVAYAAGVRHFFLLVDQLEDLATTPTVTKGKRTREVGRLRDIIAETHPFARHLHCVFTFHIRAADALGEMWTLNRLPSYDPEDPANEGSVVVLRGITEIEQVRTLLATYLDTRRVHGETGEITPFEESALPVLLQRSGGRAGILLLQAHKLFDRAAAAGRPMIDGQFAAKLLGVAGVPPLAGNRRGGPTEVPDATILDELLR